MMCRNRVAGDNRVPVGCSDMAPVAARSWHVLPHPTLSCLGTPALRDYAVCYPALLAFLSPILSPSSLRLALDNSHHPAIVCH